MSQAGQKISVHLLVEDSAGPIFSNPHPELKSAGKRYKVACTPDSVLPRAATGEASAATCPLCLKTDDYQKIKKQQSSGSAADQAVAEADSEGGQSVESP